MDVRKESKSVVDHKVTLLQGQIESKGVETGVEKTRKYHQAEEKRIRKWRYRKTENKKGVMPMTRGITIS